MSLVSLDLAPNSLGDEVFKLSDAGSISASDVQGSKELRSAYRSLAKRSLYFLAKAVLRNDKLTLRTHKPVCDFIQDPSIQKGLILLPRGVFKTTIGTEAYSIWRLINDPNDTILIANQVARHAERMLTHIEEHLGGSNTLMNWLFPEMIYPGSRHKPWNQLEMTVPNRSEFRSSPSIMTIGVGARAESIHVYCQLNDDLVGIEDMFSELNMAAALTWHDYEQSLFVDPRTGVERMYGTRWPGSDIYKPIIDSGEYKVFWRPAKNDLDDCPEMEHNELLFPEKYNDEDLRKARDKNYLMYQANIQNREVHPGSLEFKKSQLNYFNLIETPEGPACKTDNGKIYYCKDGDILLTIDPAGSGDEEMNDRAEIKNQRMKLSNNALCLGMAIADKFFQLESWAGRARGENPELQIAKKVLEIAKAWAGYIRKIYCEAFAGQGVFLTVFNMLCRQENFSVPTEELPKGTKKSKKVRIRSVVGPVAQNGQLYVRRKQDTFINEFSSFPGTMMDTLDALTWFLMMVKMPQSELGMSIQRRVLTERSNRRSRFVSRAGV